MNKLYGELLLQFMDDLSREQANAGCNDFCYPKSWTDEDIITFKTKYMKADYEEREEEITERRSDYDFCVLAGLKKMVKELLK